MPLPAPPYTIERVETAAGLQEEIDLRLEVFHREQGFSVELEVDEHDVVPGPTAHFVIRLQADGAVVGTVRVRPYGDAYKIERICVRADSRKYGFGSVLVRHAEQWALGAATKEGGLQTVISSQEQAMPFYQRLGYTAEGDKYPDEGVPHQKMVKWLSAQTSYFIATKRIVTVFGATGSQGGSVAKYLLEDGTFGVRAVTRNAESPAAQALKQKGAEIVVADLNKPETLPGTVKGAYGVSGVTDYWTLFPTIGDTLKTQEAEFAQGKALVDAAKTAGVQHFVWCTLWTAEVPHFDGKAQVDEYLKASGIPRTSLFNSAYFENLVSPVSGFQMCKKQDGGTISVEIPSPADSYMPFYSVDQTGGWVLEALKNPSKWIGKDMHAIGQHITPRQIADTIAKLTGKTTVLKSSATVEEFRMMGMSDNPVVKELYLNLNFFYEKCQPPHSMYDERLSQEGYPGVYDFEAFAKNNAKFKAFVDT